MRQKTLLIIKPNAVEDGRVGSILNWLENEGYKILALRMEHLSKERAEGFYAVHAGKEFFEAHIKFMTRSPSVIAVLEHENAVEKLRKLIGNTDPEKSANGTLRHRFGKTLRENAVHGSDCVESAFYEIGWFFPEL